MRAILIVWIFAVTCFALGCKLSVEESTFTNVELTCDNTDEVVPLEDFRLTTLSELLESLKWEKANTPPPGAPDWKIVATLDKNKFEAYVYSGSIIYWPKEKSFATIQWKEIEKELFLSDSSRWSNHLSHFNQVEGHFE